MGRKSLVLLIFIAVFVVGVSLAGWVVYSENESGPSENRTGEIRVEVIAKNFEVPWSLAFIPDGRILVTERPGKVRMIEDNKTKNETWTDIDVYANGEAGLLGIAVHPDFEKNRYVYLCYTHLNSKGRVKNRVVRYVDDNNQGEFDKIILENIPGGRVHDGGRIEFGPDGKLYITTGDSGNSSLAQDVNSLGGKILRINPKGTIPKDNPFSNSPVWSYGHRNPEGLAWHPETEQLYVLEHGPSGHDELNLIEKGKNYGWPEVRGKESNSQYVEPILESGNETWAPSGASFYSSNKIPHWKNSFFFASLGFSQGNGRRTLHRLVFSEENSEKVENHIFLLKNRYGRLRAVKMGPDGHLYVTTSNRDGRGEPDPEDDRILEIQPKN